jgi:RNA polymerase sigma factor (sigma-70 family)
MSPPHALSDGQLLALTQRGDRAAVAEIHRRYAARLGRLAAPRAGGVYDADDAVQAAFHALLADSGRFRVPAGGGLWGLLATIALNKIRSHARSPAVRLRAAGDGAEVAAAAGVAARGDDTAEVDVRDVLERLPPAERDLVELRAAGHPVEEIARRVGRPKRTVERQFQTCRTRMAWLAAADG